MGQTIQMERKAARSRMSLPARWVATLSCDGNGHGQASPILYCPYIFSKFSYNFLQLFQMSKLNCFHHHRSTDVCKNTGIGKTFYSKECFLCKNSSTGCTTSASTAPVPVVATSHMTSRVCVCACVRMNFSAIYRLVPCLKA